MGKPSEIHESDGTQRERTSDSQKRVFRKHDVPKLQHRLSELERMQAALRESEERYRTLFNSGNDAVFVHSITPDGMPGLFLEVNDLACRRLGYTRDELLGMSPADIDAHDARNGVPEIMEKLLAEKHVIFEMVHCAKDGTEIPVEISAQLFVLQGQPAILSIARDITERRQAEKALTESEARYRAIVEAFDGIVYICSRDYRVEFMNKQCIERTGRDATGEPCYQALHDRESICPWCENERVFAGETVRWEVQSPKDNRWYYVVNSPILHADGTVSKQAMILDITDRKRAEEALRENEHFLQEIFNGIQDGISVLDCDLNVVRVNEWMEKMYSDQIPLVGKKCYEVYQKRDAVCPWCPSVQTIKSGRAHTKVVPYPSGEEPTGWIELSSYPIKDEEGRLVGIIEHVKDVTERKLAEEKARIQQQQLIQADKMISLGVLVSGMAHEINNPNHFIMSHVATLSKIWKGTESILERYYEENGDFSLGGMAYSEIRGQIPEMFSAIHEGANRIKIIVDELRDYAREHRAELDEKVDVNRVVFSSITLLTNMLKKSTHRFFVEYGKDLPTVRGNFHRLEQVAINLIQNACQALPDMSKCVHIHTRHDPKAQSVVLEVRDEGVGITPDAVKHVTDPFYTTKRESGGTGLGLSISYNIILEHGGELKIASELGKGTLVTVVLPVDSEP